MAVRRLLPFALSAEELNHIGVKVSAKWSLSENARRHPIVMEACTEEARSAATPVKLSLLEIQAAAHLAEMCTDEALEPLDEYLGINPANRAIVRQRKDAASGVVRFPPPDPPEKSLSERLEHPVTLAGGVIVLALLSSPAVPLFTGAFGSAPVASSASAVICFVLATLLGIGRQTSDLAYRRALTLDFDEITAGDDDKVGEETLFGCWTMPVEMGGGPFPLSGCLSIVTGVLSLWAAGVAAAFLARSLTPREVVFAVVFGSVLALRWAVSAVASRIIVWRWTSSSKRRDPTP
jgi:hypothetical protein